MSLLLTGFGPFPGVPRNPSQLLVEGFPDAFAGRRVHRAVVPTVYGEAASIIEERLVALRPEACLCLGVAGKGPFRLERTAENFGGSGKPDQAGSLHEGPIDPDGPDRLTSTLPLPAMLEALQECGISAVISDDAGGYVCNHIFYAARRAVERHGLQVPCGFLHIPPLDGTRGEQEQFVGMRRVLELVLGTLFQSLDDRNRIEQGGTSVRPENVGR